MKASRCWVCLWPAEGRTFFVYAPTAKEARARLTGAGLPEEFMVVSEQREEDLQVEYVDNRYGGRA